MSITSTNNKINEYLVNPTKEHKFTKNSISITNQSLQNDVVNTIYLNLPYYHIFPIDENYCDYTQMSQEYELVK